MPYRSTRDARRALRELALAQQGYFTAKQAAGVGYAKQHLEYHTKAGNIERVDHGIYRLPEVASSALGELVRWSMWSRGRDGRPRGVVSHGSALAVHGLADWPADGAVHLTVPPEFRKSPPVGVVLHIDTLAEEEIEARAGFTVVRRERALADVRQEREAPHLQPLKIDVEAPEEEALERPTVNTTKRVEWASWMD